MLAKDERGLGVDEVLEPAIEAGAEDVEVDDEGNLVVWTEPSGTVGAAKILAESLGVKVVESEVLWDPKAETLVPMESGEQLDGLRALVDKLLDDSQVLGVYANVSQGSVDDAEWAELQEKIPV